MQKPEPKPRNLALRLAVGVASVYCLAGALYFGAERRWMLTGTLLVGGLYAMQWIFPRNDIEREQIHLPSDDRLAELQRITAQDSVRQKCPCCGFPTLSDLTSDCVLCEWDTEDMALSTARTNFQQYGWSYAPDHLPAWMPTPRSEGENEAARALIVAFAAHRRADRKHRHQRWIEVLRCEEQLRRAQLQRALS